MATTTSNFGWPIPQSTDLVKDGATAIASLGSGVDTSMVDLKGGTTGQILSKTSNTDMDFTWITPNPGDITGVTAGTGLTGGGTSGSVTLDFDVANYGGGQYAAGKNKIINGDFGIWQRGTSFTPSSGAWTFNADRFQTYSTWSAGTLTVARQSFTAGNEISGYENQFFIRHTAPTTGTSNVNLRQLIEDVRTFAGQQVTFSFWVKASAGRNISILLRQNFGSGGSANVDTNSSSISIGTTWTRYSFTATLPSISGKTIGTNSALEIWFYTDTNFTGGTTLDLWGWQVEAGSTATPFQTATGTIQGELAACQRYYWRTQNAAAYTGHGSGFTTSTTESANIVTYPVTMRIAPTSVDYANLRIVDVLTNPFAISALSLTNSSATIGYITSTISGATAGRFTFLQNNNNAAGYIALSAEL